MSEAADSAEREVEDFFNAEILGIKPEEEKQDTFPTEAPPESKPVEEIAVAETPTPQEEAEDAAEELDESGDESDTDDDGGALPIPDEEAKEEEYLAWAKKQYGDDLDPHKLAKAAYEKERMLGQKSESEKRLLKEAQDREIQQKLDFLNTPGVLTDEEEMWIEDAASSPDAAAAADALLNEGRADLYGAFITRWVQQGGRDAQEALQHRDRVMQWVQTPEPSPTESYASALGQTFLSLGLNIDTHGPQILQKAEELGMAHPAVSGMMSEDPNVRAIATRAVYDLAAQGNTLVRKAKTDDVVAQRVQEEQLRQNAAGVNQNGGSRPVEQKKGGFWDRFDEEIAERGWDGERPQYGRSE